MNDYDVTVIGGGPAGLAAAISARKAGARVLLIERENKLGGVLKQCIHDGFGLLRFGEKLSGCEYASRYVRLLADTDISVMTLAFVSKIEKETTGFVLELSHDSGYEKISTSAVVLATGCRERTARQVFIHGTRPAGVLTAGAAQYYINIMGQLPGKNCLILGSGDIGLIMARRLTLEGAHVIGVYEAKSEPSGLSRNLYQCLTDFDIPLYLSHTVTEVHGRTRVEAVTIMQVDERMQPVAGTEEYITCDCLILSVGLIPENELAESLNVEISPTTKGAVCDENLATSVEGVFACGNALHVNDLVDYVSESGEIAGTGAARYALSCLDKNDGGAYANHNCFTTVTIMTDTGKKNISSPLSVGFDSQIAYVVPHRLRSGAHGKLSFFYRVKQTMGRAKLKVFLNNELLFEKTYLGLKPPEMEKVEIDFSAYPLTPEAELAFTLEPETQTQSSCKN